MLLVCSILLKFECLGKNNLSEGRFPPPDDSQQKGENRYRKDGSRQVGLKKRKKSHTYNGLKSPLVTDNCKIRLSLGEERY